MLYKSAKERALLFIFLHPHAKSEDEDRRLLLEYPVTEWVVASSAMPSPSFWFRGHAWLSGEGCGTYLHFSAWPTVAVQDSSGIKIWLEPSMSCCHRGSVQH